MQGENVQKKVLSIIRNATSGRGLSSIQFDFSSQKYEWMICKIFVTTASLKEDVMENIPLPKEESTPVVMQYRWGSDSVIHVVSREEKTK